MLRGYSGIPCSCYRLALKGGRETDAYSPCNCQSEDCVCGYPERFIDRTEDAKEEA